MRRLLVVLTLAGVCCGQAGDHMVVVGNQAQPVEWHHRSTIADAILKAGPSGVVWIPGDYIGTDCNPLSSCNPGTTLIIDLRGGVFTAFPPIAGISGGGNPATAPFFVNGSSLIAFTPDPFCAFNLNLSPDIFCDWLGQPVWNDNGFNELFALTDRVNNWTAAQNFGPITVSSCTGCGGAGGIWNAHTGSLLIPTGTNFEPMEGSFTNNGTESTPADVMARAGTMTGLYVNLSVAEGAAATLAFTVRLNHAGGGFTSTSITCTVPNNGTNCNDTAHSFSWSAGDLLDVQMIQTGTGTSQGISYSTTYF